MTDAACSTLASAIALLAVSLAPAKGQAQTIAQRVASAPDGRVLLSFAARPGVCGDGLGMIHDGESFTFERLSSAGTGDWSRRCPCIPGPVRVALTVREHRVVGVHTYVGGEWDDNTGSVLDVGAVSTRQAVDYLLSLARSTEDAENAIFAATLADSVTVWPRLLQIARDDKVSRENRRQAVFWVSQAAGQAATRGLDSLVTDSEEDREIRKQAVFALSQRPEEEGVPVLLRIARTNTDPMIQREAIFWLGQSDDPRAVELFEELLTGR
jgi:HEAT repeats